MQDRYLRQAQKITDTRQCRHATLHEETFRGLRRWRAQELLARPYLIQFEILIDSEPCIATQLCCMPFRIRWLDRRRHIELVRLSSRSRHRIFVDAIFWRARLTRLRIVCCVLRTSKHCQSLRPRRKPSEIRVIRRWRQETYGRRP